MEQRTAVITGATRGIGKVIALELAANDAWPAPIQARLGHWILRAAENWTGRANSALAVGDPDRTLEAAIDAVEQWYEAHGQQPLINAPMPLAAPVTRAVRPVRSMGSLTAVRTRVGESGAASRASLRASAMRED